MLTVVVTVVIYVVARRAITPGGFVAIAARITVLPANLNHWVVKVWKGTRTAAALGV